MAVQIRNSKGLILVLLLSFLSVIMSMPASAQVGPIECRTDAPVQDDVARLVLDHLWGLEELKPLAMTLEDIFLKLTTEETLGTPS